ARWSWPLPAPHPVVRAFVAPASPWGAGHRGIDVAAGVGTTVTAPADGTVVWAGRIVDRGVVSLDHGGGLLSSFEPVTPAVARGRPVHRGDPIGRVASGGSHPPGVLHIGARRDGAYVSPLLFLGGLQRAVLLPMDELRSVDVPGGSSR
ncbi:MAG: hypothetical protein QOC59_216, partial [Microbacteriaceae bacterium]|nr:hypothetical protein [Microbacteriaceae bacterium]